MVRKRKAGFNINLIVLVLCLFTHSFGIHLRGNSQSAMEELRKIAENDPREALNKALSNLASTEFGDHVVKLVNLELTAGKGITDRVLNAMREIKVNLETMLELETAQHSKEMAMLKDQIQDLTYKSQKANTDLADCEKQILDLSKASRQLGKEIPRIKDEIEKISDQKALVEENRLQDNKDFMERVGDLRQVLAILGEISNQLTQLALSGKTPTLAQQQELIKTIKMAKVNDPILALAAMSATMDPGVIKTVVARLGNVRGIVESAVNQNDADIVESKGNYESLHDNLEMVLDRLYGDLSKATLDAAKIENDLTTQMNRREYNKRVIVAANSEKGSKQNQLQIAEDKFAARTNKLGKEIQTISDAIGIMIANAASFKASEGITIEKFVDHNVDDQVEKLSIH